MPTNKANLTLILQAIFVKVLSPVNWLLTMLNLSLQSFHLEVLSGYGIMMWNVI